MEKYNSRLGEHAPYLESIKRPLVVVAVVVVVALARQIQPLPLGRRLMAEAASLQVNKRHKRSHDVSHPNPRPLALGLVSGRTLCSATNSH